VTRYAKGTVPEYAPVDYDRHLRHVRALGLAPNSRALVLAEEMVRHCRAEGSADSFAREITSWLRFCQAIGIEPLRTTPLEVDRYLASLSNYAIGTQHLKLLVVRLFFKCAIGHHWLRDNPVVIPHSVPRIPETDTPSLTKAQAERLLSSIRADFESPRIALTAKRDYAMILVALRLALRAGELAALRWGRISESGGQMRTSFRGKGAKPATMLVPDDVWATLEKWRRAFEAASGATLFPGDPIFLGTSTRQLRAAQVRAGQTPLAMLSRGAVYTIVAGRLGDIGIRGDRHGPHCLRATAAVLSYLGGSSLIEVQALLRHSSIQTTMRYLQRLMTGAAGPAILNIRLTIPAWDELPDDAVDGGTPDEVA